MANAGPNTNGSQFFIVLGDNTGLQPNYTIFGRVTGGMGAVDRIAHVPLGPSPGDEVSKPREKVYMKSVRIRVS
jgi:cyclophilin family peptidyl-prolyl cis-trans isomerase